MDKFFVFAIVVVIILLIGYFLFLVMQERKADHERKAPDDNVAGAAQIASGSLATAAVPQTQDWRDAALNPPVVDEESMQDYEIPAGLLFDYILGLMSPESMEVVKRKLREQMNYLNPLSTQETGPAKSFNISFSVGTGENREELFRYEKKCIDGPCEETRIMERQVSDIINRGRLRRTASNVEGLSRNYAFGGLFNDQFDELSMIAEEKARKEEEEERKRMEKESEAKKPDGNVAAKEVEPVKGVDGSDGGSGGLERKVSVPVDKEESFVDDGSLGSYSENAEVPTQPCGDGGVVVDLTEEDDGSMLVDDEYSRSVFEQMEKSESEERSEVDDDSADSVDSSGDGGVVREEEREEGVEDGRSASVLSQLPDDMVSIFLNPNVVALPYCMYVSRRYDLGIEYSPDWDPDLVGPVFKTAKNICRDFTLEECLEVVKNMYELGRIAGNASSAPELVGSKGTVMASGKKAKSSGKRGSNIIVD